MRKESSVRWAYAGAGLAGTLVVLAALYHFQVRDMMTEPDGVAPERSEAMEPAVAVSDAEPSPETSDTILTCTAADGSTFYTNAPDCDKSQLDNRLSVVDAYTPEAERTPAADECLSIRVTDEEALDLFLPRCREAFMQALDLERRMLNAERPAESRLAGDYCALVSQGVANGCPARSEQFCLLRICQQRLEGQDAPLE